jgi:1-acyl-sn-glycerol-3-phosphate acyltransferase
MQWLASLVFTIFLFLWTGAYAVFFSVVAVFCPFRLRSRLARGWGKMLLVILRLICRLDYRIEGRENLPPGNHIALLKHSSSWETFAQVALLPDQVWVLKRELTWVPFLGWAVRFMHAIAVDRGAGGAAVRSVLVQGKLRLAEGTWIVIFPEGTRMAPGQTRRYGISGALLAAENERLIVPVAHDAGYYWPRRGLYKRPGTIRVVIGPPIVAAGRDARAVNEEAQNWIEAHSRH